MDRLNREEFVKAVAAKTYKKDVLTGSLLCEPEEVAAGAWFDLMTGPDAKDQLVDLTAGFGAGVPCRRVKTNLVIYRGAISTVCVPDEVGLWTRDAGCTSILSVGPIRSKDLIGAMVPKVNSQEAAARRLIKDILKGFSRRDWVTPNAIIGFLESSACVLIVDEESTGTRILYFGSFCGGPLVMLKLDMQSVTTDKLVEFYTDRVMQLASRSWKLAFRQTPLLESVDPDVDWKVFRGGVAADLSPDMRVFIQEKKLSLTAQDTYSDDLYFNSYDDALSGAFQETARSIFRLTYRLLMDGMEIQSIIKGLPPKLVESMKRLADLKVAGLESDLREEDVRHATFKTNVDKMLERAMTTRALIGGDS